MLRVPPIALLLTLNLCFWGILVFLGGLVRLFTRGHLRRRVILGTVWLAECWAAMNDRILDLFLTTHWDIEGVAGLRRDGRYLVIINHISWVDIFAVLRAFSGKAPFPRFFLKHTLFWAPMVGQAAWALDFPFMRRDSAEYLERHPEKRGRDLETTRIACRRFRGIPVSIINFIEGTRFTPEKHAEQASPYRYLLRPRVGGIAFVIAAMGEELDGVIDVTIAYPGQEVTMLDFASNHTKRITLRARQVTLPTALDTAAITEPGPERDRFRDWVEQIWREKDELLGRGL